jgi:hypothetical protein
MINNSVVADISVFENLQAIQNERFVQGNMAAFNDNADDYTEFRSNLRKVRSFTFQDRSAKSNSLESKIEPAKKAYREKFAELKKVYGATLRTSNSTTDPAKVTQYTGIKQGESGWEDAVERYRRDLWQKTMPKYRKAAEDAYEHLRKTVMDWHASVDADRRGLGFQPLGFNRTDFERQYRSPGHAFR